MKDRFKFRAFDKKTKVMFGPFAFSNNLETILVGGGVPVEEGEVYDLIIMQCTGLKDKNGKLIYEGGIVEIEGILYLVTWGGKTYPAFELDPIKSEMVSDDCNGFSYCMAEGLEIEIIGNIHENPELLTQTKN